MNKTISVIKIKELKKMALIKIYNKVGDIKCLKN